jgi:hypothetical protein
MDMSHVFILGCERSGSTWLSNVIDAHPDVEFFMEPFADYAGLFPGFPNRNLYVNHLSDTVPRLLEEGYGHLPRIKYSLFYSREKHLFWKGLDKVIIRLLSWIGSLRYLDTSSRIKQFQLLNLNAENLPVKFQSRKSKNSLLTITKELRLNFKVGAIQKNFPKAKIIIIVRHPGAQVASILNLFNRGNLGELKRSLLTLYSYLSSSSKFSKYASYYKCLDSKNDMREMLLLWWLINYETLIADCKHYNVNYKIVYNEDLSEQPYEEYQKIFSFLELEYTQEIKAYIRYSTVSKLNSQDSTHSPVDTVRDSAQYSRESISKIDDDMKLALSNLYQRFNLDHDLKHYWK